jgi:hypothetical protein
MMSGQDTNIIYSSKDYDIGDRSGWLYNFNRFLNILLTRLSGSNVEIRAIEEADLDFDTDYSSRMLLIPVVSPGLLRSAHFNEEIKKFQEKAINKEANNISWQSRVFKVVRYPLQEHYLLDFLNNSVNYNFYHIDGFTDEVIHYDDFTGHTSEKTFWLRLYDLAYDIHKVTEKISDAEEEIRRINRDINTPVVYLAEVTEEMAGIRDSIKRELLRNAYKVLPDAPIPNDREHATRMIMRNLHPSILSVHIIGSDFGKNKDADFSVVELQNALAADHVKLLEEGVEHERDHCGRVIWIAPDIGNVSVKQRLFIDKLRSDQQLLHNTELLESGVEEFKSHIMNKLSGHIHRSSNVGPQADADSKIIYLICDKDGLGDCLEIKRYLEGDGHRVLLSDFDGPINEIRNKHNYYLRICDATIIYGRNKGEDWVRSKYKDLLKSLGLGRSKPISPQAILVQDNQKIEDLLGLSGDALVLHESGSITEDVMRPFLNQLNKQ